MSPPLLPIDFLHSPGTTGSTAVQTPRTTMLFSKARNLFSSSSSKEEEESMAEAALKKEKEQLPEPRILGTWAGEVHAQEQSALLRMPAEIRNMIYEIVFTPGSREEEEEREEKRVRQAMEEAEREAEAAAAAAKEDMETAQELATTQGDDLIPTPSPKKPQKKDPDAPPHPLALLLTCRKISTDATLLAFTLHPHLLAPELTYHALRRRTQLLPPASLAAIRTLAFAFTSRHYFDACPDRHVADFLTNAALLPHVTTAIVRVTTRADDRRRPEPHVLDTQCAPHVPEWFATAISAMRAGRSYVWQAGSTWSVSYAPRSTVHDDWLHRSVWQSAIRCREECAAVLQQEGSARKLCVKLEYVWDWEAVRRRQALGLNVRLVSGGELEGVREVCGGTGLVWDPEGGYWEGLRRRRGRGGKGWGEVGEMLWKGSLARFLLRG